MALIPLMPIQQHIVNKLQAGLPRQLTYHCLSHTLDVLKQVKKVALEEGVQCPEELLILQVAALYHDAGFVQTYQDHEAQGCEIAKQELPGFGLNQQQIEKVCNLIRATKVPQNPQSHLEQIICDADLDYLGREDFTQIAQHLYQELLSLNILSGEEEWNALQIEFLEKHQYFTKYAKQNRERKKQAHLQILKAKAKQIH